MNKKNHLQGKQNKGFTLVEVLIAMTILAIIVVPLLHAFVTSSRTNAKAKQLMKATTLAQNVMEELKANSIEEIARQFNSSSERTYTTNKSLTGMAKTFWESQAVTSGTNTVLTPVVTSDKAEAAKPATSSIRDIAGSTTGPGNFVGQDGEYHFFLKEVTRESAKFDIAVELKLNAASGTKQLTQINAMNQADCGYYAEEKVTDNAVASFINLNNGFTQDPEYVGALNQTNIYSLFDRTITIDIADSNGNQTVSVRYDYEMDLGYVPREDRFYSETITIFDNYLTDEKLKAVYLYYHPLYESEDTIYIVNNDNLDVDVYLIKMFQTQGVLGNTSDANYFPVVELQESEKSTSGVSHATICTNIKNKDSFRYIVPSGSLAVTDLGNAKAVECFYDVKIDVYKHDASNTGTTFDEANRITTFTGSKMDNSNKKR